MNPVKYPMSSGTRKSWLADIASDIRSWFIHKFEAGQKAHGDIDLGDVPMETLLNEMLAESLDQLAYSLEMKRRFDQKQLVVINRDNLQMLCSLIEDYRTATNIKLGSRELAAYDAAVLTLGNKI